MGRTDGRLARDPPTVYACLLCEISLTLTCVTLLADHRLYSIIIIVGKSPISSSIHGHNITMMIIKYTRRPVHYAHVMSEAHTTTSQPDMYSSGVDLIPLRSILVSCLSSSSEIRAISRLLQYTHSSPNQWLNGNKTRVPGIQVCADFNNKTIIINTHEPIDWWPT